jgi:hypothetical protein
MFDPGYAYGRFSPDGRYLALQVSVSFTEPGAFVLVDLSTGAIVAQHGIAVRTPGPRTAAEVHAVPFDFTPDSQHVVVADWSASPARLLVVRTADGAIERTIEHVGPVASLATLDAVTTPPTTPLVDAGAAVRQFDTGSVLAVLSTSGTMLTTVDIDTGIQRVVGLQDAPAADTDSQPRLVSLDGGFAWIRNGEAWFAPPRGDPVSLGPATYIVPGGEPTEAWLVERGGNGFQITQLDGATGARGRSYRSAAAPQGAVRDGLVIGRAASFTEGSEFEIWNPVTRRSRHVSVDARDPVITTASGSHIVWYDQACSSDGGTCGTSITDVTTGRTDTLPDHAFPFGTSALPPNGNRLYAPIQDDRGNTRLAAIDLTTLQSVDVPSSEGAEQWAASSRGFVVFQSDAIYVWQPDWPAAKVLSPGTVGIVGGFAVR